MKFDIERSIIDATTHCDKKFSCLNNQTHIFCKVINCIGNEVHVVSCTEAGHCSYKFSYGSICICNCPVRKEIFRKYKV